MDKIRAGIETGNKLWIKSFETGDAQLLASAFHDEGAVLGANGKVIEGKKAVCDYFKTWMAQIGPSLFTIETIDVYDVSGDIFEKGQYTLTIENGNRYEGKYIVEWKCVEGKYLIYRDIGI